MHLCRQNIHIWQRWRRTVVCPVLFLLILPASTNYQLRDYSFDSGGSGASESTNYATLTLNGEQGNLRLVSSNYETGAGLIFTNQANVPTAPTLVSNNNYNKLLLTLAPGSDPTDTEYAIAITTDNFVTTNYVQSDDSVNTTLGEEDWETYSARGGAAGFYILGLTNNTIYTVKVKARQGDFTETDWGPTVAAATATLSISFSLGGVASGTTVEGVTTDITTTSTAVSFGELTIDQRREAAQTLTVTTNAINGYTAMVRQAASLVDQDATVFPPVSGTNAAPEAWPTTVYTGAFGYHSSDGGLGTGTTNRFVTTNTFAGLETTARELAYASSAVTNQETSVVFAIQAGKAQPPGNYAQTIIYTIYGAF